MDARTKSLLHAGLLLASIGHCACSSGESRATTERLRAEQFAGARSAAATKPAAEPQPTESRPSQARGAAEPAGAEASRRDMPADTLALRSFVGEPDVAAAPATPTDKPIILESVIGQINGRPLFASEVLTPLDGRLRAFAADSRGDRARFARDASNDLIGVITSKVRDELILAEAQASLPLETRQGLFYFLGKIQQNLVSTQSGSALQADEALRESTGRTLQEEARDRLERELINNELRTKVIPRVNVPWRLIRQDYERNFARYNPPGSATLRVIAVAATDVDAVREAEEAISTKPFADAASMEFNTFLRSQGGLAKRELSVPYGQSQLFADKAMTEAAQRLAPGQTTSPIPWDGKLAWIHLEALDPGKGVSLYDAQLEIESALRDRKFGQERDVYLRRLLERGSFTRIDSMVQEAMTIAIERYMPVQAH